VVTCHGCYDGLYRGIARIVKDGDNWDRTDYYYSESWQVLEERFADDVSTQNKGTPATAVSVQWLWDIRYVDSPVLRDENKDPGTDNDCTEAGDERLYYVTDAQMNVTALVDGATGEVVERYMYDPYGKATICEEDWTPRQGNASAYSNEILFAGYRFDSETGLYSTGDQVYHPTLGRGLQRSPSPILDGGDLNGYVPGPPVGSTDSWDICGGPAPNPGDSDRWWVKRIGPHTYRILLPWMEGMGTGIRLLPYLPGDPEYDHEQDPGRFDTPNDVPPNKYNPRDDGSHGGGEPAPPEWTVPGSQGIISPKGIEPDGLSPRGPSLRERLDQWWRDHVLNPEKWHLGELWAYIQGRLGQPLEDLEHWEAYAKGWRDRILSGLEGIYTGILGRNPALKTPKPGSQVAPKNAPTNRYRIAGLPTRRGSFRFIPPKGVGRSTPKRGPNKGWMDNFGNEWIKGPPHHFPGQPFEWDVQLPDGTYINVSPQGVIAL
jgi:RHS repeat-associated protein